MYVRRHPHFWLWMHHRWREFDEAREIIGDTFPLHARIEDESHGVSD
jgi:hypothetical protein